MKIIKSSHDWWLFWGILSPILFALSCLSWFYITPYALIFFEFIPSALFGLWIINKSNFTYNCVKFCILSLLLFAIIFIFGYNATWITPALLLISMKLIQYTKDEFLWSFGSMLLYGVLGLIPFFILLLIEPLSSSNLDSLSLVMSKLVGLFLMGYFCKGALYGTLLHMFYKRRSI